MLGFAHVRISKGLRASEPWPSLVPRFSLTHIPKQDVIASLISAAAVKRGNADLRGRRLYQENAQEKRARVSSPEAVRCVFMNWSREDMHGSLSLCLKGVDEMQAPKPTLCSNQQVRVRKHPACRNMTGLQAFRASIKTSRVHECQSERRIGP